MDEGPKRGRFDGELARSLGIRGRDFARLEAGRRSGSASAWSTPDDVMGPPRAGPSVVYSGDSAPSERVRKLSQGATLLIHEATAAQDLEVEANKWGHSSARQAGELALAASVGGLFLTHFSSRYKETQALEDEAKALFVGARAAHDLLDHLILQP